MESLIEQNPLLKKENAYKNLSDLKNLYPCDGIIVGMDEEGNFIQIYWTAKEDGRSRIHFVMEEGILKIVKDKDSYIAMTGKCLTKIRKEGKMDNFLEVVSNGNQIVNSFIKRGLWNGEYNSTQEIIAISNLHGSDPPVVKMAIPKSNDENKQCSFEFSVTPGYGYCITNNLSFSFPRILPLIGKITEDIADSILEYLENKILLAVKSIDYKKELCFWKVID